MPSTTQSSSRRELMRVLQRSRVALVALAVVGFTAVVSAPNSERAVANASNSITLDEPFTGATLNNPGKWISVRGGTALEWPCLTAANAPILDLAAGGVLAEGVVQACVNQGGTAAADGDGAMRLTRRRPAGENPLLSGASSLLYADPLSASEGIDISFSIRMESNEAADGIGFFVKDGSNATNTLGPAGGALGYGLNNGTGSGVPGAIFGVGFDGFGSFSWDGISSGGTTCVDSGATRGAIRSLPTLAQAKSSLVVRGPDLSNGAGTSGYCYLAGLDVTFSGAEFQRVRVKVEPQTGNSTTLSVYLASHSSPSILPDTPTLTTTVVLTSTFRFGFSASTGYWSNNHDIRGLAIRPAGPAVSALVTSAATGSGTGPTSGGTTLTINGSNFVAGATITVDGEPCTNVAVNAGGTELSCTTPPGSIGTKEVVVRNPNGGPGYGTFTYVNPGPTVTSVNPSRGTPDGGNTVTIIGTGFVDGATATLGGQSCTNVVVASSTSLTCTAPSGADGSVVDAVVTNIGDVSGTGAGLYTYTSQQVVESSVTSTTTPAAEFVSSMDDMIEQQPVRVRALPKTGFDISSLALFGMSMMACAAAVTFMRRRLTTN